MVFANNAVYSRDSGSIRFPNGAAGVTVAGNVVLGAVTGVAAGYVTGNGLADFVNLSWDAANRDGTPSPTSALLGRADPAHVVTDDLQGATRTPPVDVGAYERGP
jgi:hypothetical protein